MTHRVKPFVPLLAVVVLASGCAGRSPSPDPIAPRLERPSVHSVVLLEDDVSEEMRAHFGIGTAGRDIHPSASDQVRQQILALTNPDRRRGTEAVLARQGRYRDLILRELRSADAPEDLLYIPFIESGYNPSARSRSGAVGLWQFMPSTAESVGLRVDEWVDERLDPVRSTEAAVRYLTELFSQTGDWGLAAAAYNGGIGRITRLSEGHGTDDFFTMSAEGVLHSETSAYVPRVIAAAMIGHDPIRFGLDEPSPMAPLFYDSVQVGPGTLLSAVASAAGVSEEQVRELNLHFVRGATPPSENSFVRLPNADVAYDGDRIRAALEAISPERRFIGIPDSRISVDTVRPGDSLWGIAKRNGVSLESLRRLNPDAGDLLYPGQTVRVGREVMTYGGWTAEEIRSGLWAHATGGVASGGLRDVKESGGALGEQAWYVVRPGDSLHGLSRTFGVSVAQLMEWNGIAQGVLLYVGERLRIAPPEPRTHIVAPGDNLSVIAKRYGVTIDQIVRLNGIENPNRLLVGRVLRIDPPADQSSP